MIPAKARRGETVDAGIEGNFRRGARSHHDRLFRARRAYRHRALARLPGSRATQALPSWFNIVISNVPGPNRPMYFDRAAATHYFPVSIPYHNNALNITVQSYCDTLDFGLVACRRAVPDA